MPRFSPEYRRYMQSPAWQRYRQRVLIRDRRRCVRCGSKRQLEVDHLTYQNFMREKLSDCQTLCRPCHRKKTKQQRRGRFWRKHGATLVSMLVVLGLLVAALFF